MTQIQGFPTGIENYNHKYSPLRSREQRLEQSRVVLSEVLVTIGVEDGPTWVAVRQLHTSSLTVSVVLCPTIDGKVGRLVDKCSSLGIGADGGSLPEGAAEVDLPELVGI